MDRFVHTSHAQRVVFGDGALHELGAEIERLGATRALVLSTPQQRADAERVAELLGTRAAGLYDRATMHVPIETAREAREVARRLGADCAVAIGGGSTIGLGKAIALAGSDGPPLVAGAPTLGAAAQRPGAVIHGALPILAIPTTYAGSEMTPIYGLTDGGIKKTGRDSRVLPRTVIYDPELTYSLPVGLSVTSAINAIAHAAEALYAPDANPITALLAQEGIAALGRAIPALRAQGSTERSRAGRADALYGAWLCGAVLAQVSMGLHHKLCHTLGGSFDLPHAETHTAVLPHALAYNASAAPQAMQRIASALGVQSAAQGAYDLARNNGASTALRDLGMKADDIDRACELALQDRYPNPRPLQRDAIRRLLQHAFDGTSPEEAT